MTAQINSAFTYQGLLNEAGVPANGMYDFEFKLYDIPSGGTPLSVGINAVTVPVSNGLFSVALDFSQEPFNGAPLWLEASVRTGTNGFLVLSPRQRLTPIPYALSAATLSSTLPENQLPAVVARLDSANQVFSGNAIFSGAVTLTNQANLLAGSFAGIFAGNGAGLTNLDHSRPITLPTKADETNFIVDFAAPVVEFRATNAIFFLQSTNRPSANRHRESVWYIRGGDTNSLLTVNSNWVGVGVLATNRPFLLLSNKLVLVAFAARGNEETNVVYAIARQE